MKRRNFIAGTAAASLIYHPASHANASAGNLLKGKAEHVISIWLGGGMGQIDNVSAHQPRSLPLDVCFPRRILLKYQQKNLR